MPNFKVRTLETPEKDFDYIIEITEGPFDGLCFHYGKIELGEDDGQGNGQIKFDYDIAFLPENVTLEDNKELIDEVAGNVLTQIINDIVEREKNSEENRNTDSEQPIN
jgi:hypothetical protein